MARHRDFGHELVYHKEVLLSALRPTFSLNAFLSDVSVAYRNSSAPLLPGRRCTK